MSVFNTAGLTISVVPPGRGETLAAGPMTLRVLENGQVTEHRIGLVEITMPPGVGGPPQHVHRKHDETFYVVSGTPTFTCGSDVLTAEVGTLVTAPIGAPHTFANPADTPAVILCTVTPDLYLDYFRELDRLPKSPGGLDHATVAEIMKRYATETFMPPT
jgi:mannose-6-phosphate isomerase-like protein (cupin superfamily)